VADVVTWLAWAREMERTWYRPLGEVFDPNH
jgi:hypothetical protein